MTERFPFADGVRAVLFDVGNTLLWIDHARIAGIARGCGVATDAASVRRAELHARPRLDPVVRAAARRESVETSTRYAREILAGLDPPAAPDAAARAVGAIVAVWPTLWTVEDSDAAPTLDLLAARGFAVGCISNSAAGVRPLLERAGLASRLACIVDSSVEGVEKPDPRIFRIAAERLALPPAACVYVGDFLSLDAEGARAAGMHGVLLDPVGAWGERGVPRVASLAEIPLRLPRQPCVQRGQ